MCYNNRTLCLCVIIKRLSFKRLILAVKFTIVWPIFYPLHNLLRCLFVFFSLTEADQHLVQEQLQILKGKNLIKEMEPGKWVRKVLDEETGMTCEAVPYCFY